MKRRAPKLCAFLFLFFLTIVAFSQQKTDVNRDIDIVKVYEQTVEEGYPTLEIYQKLANAQYFRSNYREAKKWFEKWFEMEVPKDKAVLLRYKQTLKALRVSFKDNKYLAITANRD